MPKSKGSGSESDSSGSDKEEHKSEEEDHDDESASASDHKKHLFHIVSDMHGKVLDVRGEDKDAGAELIVWSRHSPTAKNQLWYTDEKGYIRSALTDFALDAKADQYVVLKPFNDEDSQQWKLDGKQIKNESTGEVLDIARESHSDGAKVCSYPSNENKNQDWHLDYVE